MYVPAAEAKAVGCLGHGDPPALSTATLGINSQSLAACLDPTNARLAAERGRTFQLTNTLHADEAIALWANTTLGLISFWWTGGRQQLGRSVMPITKTAVICLTLDAPDDSAQEQIGHSGLTLRRLPATTSSSPPTRPTTIPARQALDRAVLIDLLGLPESILEPLALLRLQWCAEPTVHGGKSTRPPD